MASQKEIQSQIHITQMYVRSLNIKYLKEEKQSNGKKKIQKYKLI